MADNKKKKKKNISTDSKAKNRKSSNAVWIVTSLVMVCLLAAAGVYMIQARKTPDTLGSMPLQIEDSLNIEQGDSAEAQAIAEDTEKHENAIEGFSELAKSDTSESADSTDNSEASLEQGGTGSGWDGVSGWSGGGSSTNKPEPTESSESASKPTATIIEYTAPTPVPSMA